MAAEQELGGEQRAVGRAHEEDVVGHGKAAPSFLWVTGVNRPTAVLLMTLVVAFLAFTGVAATVPGGLVQPGSNGAAGAPLPEGDLLVLAAADALIAFLLGYRAAALRVTVAREALLSAATYAAAIAIGAAAVRAMEIPRLLGPALLTLAFYLWDAFQGASPARRREARWVWQMALLLGLAVVVVAWNLLLRP